MRSGDDALLGTLIGLVRAIDGNDELVTGDTARLIRDTLASIRDGQIGEREAGYLMGCIAREKQRLAPGCAICAMPCGRTADYDLADMDSDSPAVRKLKESLIARALSLCDKDVPPGLIMRMLYAVGLSDAPSGYLRSLDDEAAACCL